MQQLELFDQEMPSKDTHLIQNSPYLWRLNQTRRAIDRLYFAYQDFDLNYLQSNKDKEYILQSPYSFDAKIDNINKAVQSAFLQIINMQSELVSDREPLSNDLNKDLLDETVRLISAIIDTSSKFIRTDYTAVFINAELDEPYPSEIFWFMLKAICRKNLRILVKPGENPNEYITFWNTSIGEVYDKVKDSKTKCIINFLYDDSDDFMSPSVTASLVNQQ